jgi:anti-sigma B factor antagonist/stage II sporulation protein AA (anti-sigma F factor antagonist)
VEFSRLRLADVIVLAPVGRIDHTTAEAFQLAIEPLLVASASMHGALLFDLSRVDYMSSVGLRVVMMAAKHLRARQARIAAADLQPVVREIFEIARFSHVVELFPSMRDALRALSAPALDAYDAGGGSSLE